MAAEKTIEYVIDDNETGRNIIAREATKFLFQNAEEDAKNFIKNNQTLKKLSESEKKSIIKRMIISIMEETLEKLKEKIHERY